MELNYFIFIGLILRYLYYWSNSTYSMEYLKTKLWKTIIFSIIVTITFWYISFSINLSLFNEWWHEAFIALTYVFVGWSVDSIFLSVMKLYEVKFNKKINENENV